jgi:hypothetical protein
MLRFSRMPGAQNTAQLCSAPQNNRTEAPPGAGGRAVLTTSPEIFEPFYRLRNSITWWCVSSQTNGALVDCVESDGVQIKRYMSYMPRVQHILHWYVEMPTRWCVSPQTNGAFGRLRRKRRGTNQTLHALNASRTLHRVDAVGAHATTEVAKMGLNPSKCEL